MQYALKHDPNPMRSEDRHRLTWEAATERFLDAAEITPEELPNPIERGLDRIAWGVHNTLSGAQRANG